jgi:hypothetical protein
MRKKTRRKKRKKSRKHKKTKNVYGRSKNKKYK